VTSAPAPVNAIEALPFGNTNLKLAAKVNRPGGKETQRPLPEDAFKAAANAALLSGFAGEPPYAVMSAQVPVGGVALAVPSNLVICADVIWTMPRTIQKAITKTIIGFARFLAGPIPTRGASLIFIRWASNRFIVDDSNNLYEPGMWQRYLKETIISTRAKRHVRQKRIAEADEHVRLRVGEAGCMSFHLCQEGIPVG
jgi:hypothetical protein